MRAIMNWGTAAMLSLTITAGLSACTTQPTNYAKPQAAELYIAVDSSSSTAFISSPTYANMAITHASEEVTRLHLGDKVTIGQFGARTVENAVPVLSVTSSYKLRLPTVRKRVETALHDLMARNRTNGGQDATDMTYSLENATIHCGPGSIVMILTDGVIETERYSVSKELAMGKAIHLERPSSAYLSGCSVVMVGVGMAPYGKSPNAETLPNDQVKRLQAGLREYFKAAGARDIRFASVL